MIGEFQKCQDEIKFNREVHVNYKPPKEKKETGYTSDSPDPKDKNE